MKNGTRRTRIITDPVHRVMNFGTDHDLHCSLFDIIDAPDFQRLRRISQLGLASHVFPGATHSRFSHALGVAYLAHRVLEHLREWSDSETTVDEIQRASSTVIMAAALHDIGHGPFSHSFERVLHGTEWAPDHEDWTRAIVTDPISDIHRRLTKHGFDPEVIASLFSSKSTDAKLDPLFAEIVSSQIDVDRMDYLLRDSHFGGVAIGEFDAQYLIHSMVIVSHGNERGPRSLGLTIKGVKAYEAFLLARQLMTRTLYYHPVVRVFEFMVEHIFRTVIQDIDELSDDKCLSPLIPEYFVRISNHLRRANSGATPKKQNVLQEDLQPYLALTDDVAWGLISGLARSTNGNVATRLAKRLIAHDPLESFTIERGKEDLLKRALESHNFNDRHDFHLVDAKAVLYKADGHKSVFVMDEFAGIKEVAEHSEMIAAFRDRPETEWLLVILNDGKADDMLRVAKEGRFIHPESRVGRR